MINDLPKNWSTIIVDQFIELSTIDSELNSTEILIEKIAILLDIGSDDEIFDDISFDESFDILSNVKWLNDVPSSNYLKSELGEFKLKELKYLTLGEFIDLEYYFGLNYYENIKTIAAILYRKEKLDEWDNIITEPYKYNIEKRSEFFSRIPIIDIFGIIPYYLNYKKFIVDNYESIFNPNNDVEIEEEVEEDDTLNRRQIAEKEVSKKIEEANNKMSWEKLIYDLSGGDITKFYDIVDLPLIKVLNDVVMLQMKR